MAGNLHLPKAQATKRDAIMNTFMLSFLETVANTVDPTYLYFSVIWFWLDLS